MTDVVATDLHDLRALRDAPGQTPAMPVMFVGHGNPMNAIEDNAFTRTWKTIGRELPRPKAILSISAHWLTPGSTRVTVMQQPRTIHDFGGFPRELYEQQYPASGSPQFAGETMRLVVAPEVEADVDWGLDHGTWSVLKPMFPLADIPVFQLSIDYARPPSYHYELAAQLKPLRERGVLIIGSGNIVHNLVAMRADAGPYDWALEFDHAVGAWLQEGNHRALVQFRDLGEVASMAQPTIDHYLPLLYVAALQETHDSLRFFNEGIDLGSVSMRSVLFTRSTPG